MKLYQVSECDDSPGGSLLFTSKAEAVRLAKSIRADDGPPSEVDELTIAKMRLPELLCALHNQVDFAASQRRIWPEED